MSDHESLRNDARPLYQKSYKRRLLLLPRNLPSGGLRLSAGMVRPFEREVGWTDPAQWGCFTVGMGFTLLRVPCRASRIRVSSDPHNVEAEVGCENSGERSRMVVWRFYEQNTVPAWREVSDLAGWTCASNSAGRVPAIHRIHQVRIGMPCNCCSSRCGQPAREASSTRRMRMDPECRLVHASRVF